jgi:hypothetical protein
MPMNRLLQLSILVLAGLASPGSRAADGAIKHDFLAIDEGLVTLLRVAENDPAKNWTVPIGRTAPRDLQLVGGGRVLVGHDAGYTEFELATGKVAREVTRHKGVTSVRRLPGGNTLLAGVNLDGANGIVILEVDDAQAVQRKSVLPGNYVRLLRETTAGSFLFVSNAVIREVTREGASLHEWTVAGFRNAWKAVRLPNGHTLASAGYGAFLVELDGGGAVVRKFGAKGEVPAAVNPNFYATFQLLRNGHVVVANWQGHGPGHGASGVQLLEFDRAGVIVWTWSEAKRISSLQGVLVLDGLDPAVLHDEREGVMAPIGAGASDTKK